MTLFCICYLQLLKYCFSFSGFQRTDTSYKVHSHGGGEDENEDEKEYLWTGSVVLAAIIFFFFLERLFQHLFRWYGLQHSHSHGGGEDLEKTEKDSNEDLRAVGYLNLLSDGVHNLVDGFAIGAAYSVGVATGFSTTLAIAFHEIPQELGDFAILIHAGFSKKQALFFNFLTALTNVVGTVIGVAVGVAVQDADKWLLAFVAGTFLYIALIDMFPQLLKQQGWKHFLVQTVGLLVGMGAMLILGVFEEEDECL